MPDTNAFSRRRFLQATGVAGGVVLAGCNTGDEPTDTETEVDEPTDETEAPDTETESGNEDENEGDGDATLELITSSTSSFDPIVATDLASINVILQVFDGLLYYPDGTVDPEPMLASDYEVSDDYRTYTFELKEGVTYHDGGELTAEDVVYSFERLVASENSQRSFFALDGMGISHDTETTTDDEGEEVEVYEPGTLAVEAEDDTTVSITLDEPFHATLPVLAYASFAVIPAGYVDDVPGYDGEVSQDEFENEPVGAGPFVFENYETDTSVEVSRFDDYHGDLAQVDGVHWQVIEDDEAAYNYAMNKNADVFGLPSAHYDPEKIDVEETDDRGRTVGTYGPLRNDETANYLAVPTVNTYYVGFNQRRTEKAARQAVAYALDQQVIVEQLLKGRAAPAYLFTPPSIFPDGATNYAKMAEEEYPYSYEGSNLDAAREVMEEAGYSEDDRYEFTLNISETDTYAELASLLRDQLASAHIDLEVEQGPFATILGRSKDGNLDAWISSWWMDWPTPDNFLQLAHPPKTDTREGDPIVGTDWRDTDAAERANEAWEEVVANAAPTDEAKEARNEAYLEMERANWEDVVMLTLYHAVEERLWYDWLDVPRFGGAGSSRQKFNRASVGDRS